MTEYVTITEAARRSGMSTKTIQRAIQAGKLMAYYPQPNRCEIEVAALDTFLCGQVSGHVHTVPEDRLAELEQRVQRLEHLVETLLSRQEASKPPRTTKTRERTTGPLPKHLVPLLTFAQLHNMSESKVLTHVDISLLPAKRGEWSDHSGTMITLAFDAKGRQAFYQLYRDLPSFLRCDQCPHGYLDTPVQVEKSTISLRQNSTNMG